MRKWIGWLLGVLVCLAGLMAWWTLQPSARGENVLVLTEVDGQVSIENVQGNPVEVKVGTALSPEDLVETSASSRAVLGLGRETRIRLGPESALRVVSVDGDDVRLELEGGALQATVRPDSGAVRVTNGGRSVLATNADFSIVADEELLVVGSTRGSISLSGVDVTRVEEGSVATIVDRAAEIGPVPQSLLLNVEWPRVARTRETHTLLTGTTTPGAQVQVEGDLGVRRVRADGSGAFELELPLSEGTNGVRITALDLFGNRADVDGELQTRDTKGPSFSGGVRYGN